MTAGGGGDIRCWTDHICVGLSLERVTQPLFRDERKSRCGGGVGARGVGIILTRARELVGLPFSFDFPFVLRWMMAFSRPNLTGAR
jgi:hypothetical protein